MIGLDLINERCHSMPANHQPESTESEIKETDHRKPEHNSFVRRRFLKGAVATGIVSTGLLGSTSTAQAVDPPVVDGEGVQQKSTSFLEVSVSVPSPPDAIELANGRRFPIFILSSDGVFLPDAPSGLLEGKGNGRIIATSDHISAPTSDGRFKIEEIGTTSGNLLANPEPSDDIVIRADRESAEITIGGVNQKVVPPHDSSSHSMPISLTYDTINGPRTAEVPVKVQVTNHGPRDLFGHNELVIIPKKSRAGTHISEIILPKLKENGAIGNLVEIVDIPSIAAWGHKFKGGS